MFKNRVFVQPLNIVSRRIFTSSSRALSGTRVLSSLNSFSLELDSGKNVEKLLQGREKTNLSLQMFRLIYTV